MDPALLPLVPLSPAVLALSQLLGSDGCPAVNPSPGTGTGSGSAPPRPLTLSEF